MAENAELLLKVGLDLQYFRRELKRIGSELAGEPINITLKFERQMLANQLRNLDRYIRNKKFRVEIQTNLDNEIDKAEKLARLLSQMPPASSGSAGRIGPRTAGATARIQELQRLTRVLVREGGFDAAALRRVAQAAIDEGIGGIDLTAPANKLREQLRIGFALAADDANKGLINKLLDGTTEVGQATAKMGNTILDTLRTTLDTRSPSKKTEKIGKDTGEGLTKGIVSSLGDGETRVNQALNRLVGLFESAGRAAGMAFGRSFQEGRQAAIKPGIQGALLGGAGGAATGATVGGIKALGAGVAGGLGKMGAMGAWGIAREMGRLGIGDTAGLTGFVQDVSLQVFESALHTGGEALLIGAAGVGGAAALAGFAKGSLKSLTRQALEGTLDATKSLIASGVASVSSGDLKRLVVREIVSARLAIAGIATKQLPAQVSAAAISGARDMPLLQGARDVPLLPSVTQTSSRRMARENALNLYLRDLTPYDLRFLNLQFRTAGETVKTKVSEVGEQLSKISDAAQAIARDLRTMGDNARLTGRAFAVQGERRLYPQNYGMKIASFIGQLEKLNPTLRKLSAEEGAQLLAGIEGLNKALPPALNAFVEVAGVHKTLDQTLVGYDAAARRAQRATNDYADRIRRRAGLLGGAATGQRLLAGGVDPQPFGLLPSVSQSTARRESIASGLQAIFDAGGPRFPEGPSGKLALTAEALRGRIDAILAEYLKAAKATVKQVFDPQDLQRALRSFSFLTQELQDAVQKVFNPQSLTPILRLFNFLSQALRDAELRTRLAKFEVPKSFGVLPETSQTTARRTSVAAGLQAIFAAGGPVFPEGPSGKLALSIETLKKRVDTILADYFRVVEVAVAEVFDEAALKPQLKAFDRLAQALQSTSQYVAQVAAKMIPSVTGRLLAPGRQIGENVGAQEQVVRNFYEQLRKSAQMFAENFNANSYLPESTRRLAAAMDGAATTLRALSAGKVAGILPSREMLDARKFASAIQKAIVVDFQNAIATQMGGRLLPPAGGTRGFQRMLADQPSYRAPDVGPARPKIDMKGKVLPLEERQKFQEAINKAAEIDARNAARAAFIALRQELNRGLLPAAGQTSASRRRDPGVMGIFNTIAEQVQFATGQRYAMGGPAQLRLPAAGMTGANAAQEERIRRAYERSAERARAVMGEGFGGGRPPGGGAGGGMGFLPGGGDGARGIGGFGRAMGQINLPGSGLIRELGQDFAFATKQVLLFGQAYKLLGFLQSFPAQVIQASASLQSYRNSLQSVTKTSDEFEASSNFVLDLVDKYNIPLEAAEQGFLKLYASMAPAGFSGEEIRGLFTGISQAAATFGMSSDKVDRVTYAFAQMASKGQVMSEELKGQLGDVLPGAMAIFAAAAGLEGPDAIQKFSEALEDGAFKGKNMVGLIKNVRIELTKEFGPGAEGAAKTVQGALTRMQNSVTLLYRAFEPISVNFLNAVVVPVSQGLKTITDGFTAFFTGTAAKTAGGAAFATELERIKPAIEGIGRNLQQLLPIAQAYGGLLLELGKLLLNIAGSPITGFFLKLYAVILPANMALNLFKTALAGNIGTLVLFNLQMLRAGQGMQALALMAQTGAGTLKTLTANTLGFNLALLANPYVLAAAGLTAITIAAYNMNDAFKEFVDNIPQRFNTFWDSLANDATYAIEQVKKAWRDLSSFTSNLLSKIADIAQNVWTNILTFATNALRAVGIEVEDLGAIFGAIANELEYFWNLAFYNIRKNWQDTVAFIINNANPVYKTLADFGIVNVGRAAAKGLAPVGAKPSRPSVPPPGGRQASLPSPSDIDLAGGGGAGKRGAGKAANEAKRLAEEIARQARSASDALFAEQQRFATLKEMEPMEKAFAEYASREAIIQRELNQELEEAKSQKEKIDIVEKAALRSRASSLQLEQDITKSGQEAFKTIEQIVIDQGKQLRLEQDMHQLVSEGMTPERAEQVAKVKELVREQLKVIDADILNVKAILAAKVAREGETKAVEDLREALRKLEEDRRRTEGKGAEAEAGVPEAKPKTAQDYISEGMDEARKNLEQLTNAGYQLVSAANAIGDAFGESFRGLISGSMTAQQALANFFQSVGDYFADMAARMIAEWIKMQIIGLAQSLLPGIGSMFGTALSGLSGAGALSPGGFGMNVPSYSGVGGISGGGLGSLGSGGGFGVWTGPRFANGGIVTGPTMSLVGEGRYNEAIVPLPDGKSIPVDLKGAMGGNLSVVVNVDASGSEVAGDEGQAKALGSAISAAVQAEIIKQKRPGGLLTR